ncbi:MAG: ATP-binding protein [Candidatus Gastranaerophilaceae bacterium]
MNLSKLAKDFWWSLTAFLTINNLPDSVIFINSEGKIEQYNKKAQEVFGLVYDEFNDIKFDDIVQNGIDKVKDSIKLSKPVLATATIPGREFYVELNATKKGSGMCVSLRDMTKLTDEIINDEKTLKFNNEKNAMLAKLEGDIKSPITSISGFSQGLLDGLGGELTEKQAKYVKIINNNAEELYHFMDKFLEFSQAESSIYEADYHNFDIVETLKAIIKDLDNYFKAKNVSFEIDYEAIEKRSVYADLNAIRRIFRNIVEVALSSTENGCIYIKLSYPDEASCGNYKIEIPANKQKSYIQFTVKDTSSGIPEEEMKYLCEPYAQLEKGKKNLLRALKLGTASILVKRANGVICIRSEVMKGTEYSLLLPVEKSLNE